MDTQQKKCQGHSGFTLIEVIITMVILAILMAVAAPTMIGFLENGKQVSRSNVARTLYLAAQDQLTEKRLMKTISEFSAPSEGLVKDRGVDFSDSDINAENVVYISKPKGVTSGKVYELLDPVILDKTILQDAILIEYNRKTGVVLSVFYSDMVTALDYTPAGGDQSVYGKRLYQNAASRKQGYYGVEKTGTITDLIPVTITLKDGYSNPLLDGFEEVQNVLYAEMVLPESSLTDENGVAQTFDLKLDNRVVEQEIRLTKVQNSLPTALSLFDPTGESKTALIYREDGDINFNAGTEITDPARRYARFLWVIDYVGGDMTDLAENKKHSIVEKYGVFDADKNIQAAVFVKATGLEKASVAKCNPYYYTEAESLYGNGYKVGSARHLYNLRHCLDGSFMQMDSDTGAVDAQNIDLTSITNFEPIGDSATPFTGTYNGAGLGIENLTVNLAGRDYVGLFGSVLGDAKLTGGYEKASVVALTLYNPTVLGNSYVGALAGENNSYLYGIGVQTYDRTCRINGTGDRVGGIVGQNDGWVTDSSLISSTATVLMSGGADVGGIVGNNTGAIKRTIFLALAPKSGAGNILAPFAGSNTAPVDDGKTLVNLYYLCGVAIRPATTNFNYNVGTTNGIGVQQSTIGFYKMDRGTSFSEHWGRTDVALTDEQLVNTANQEFSYPYLKMNQGALPQHPRWPIAEDLVDADILVDGRALISISEFEMPLPATTKLSEPTDPLRNNRVFDDCFDPTLLDNTQISTKVVKVTNRGTVDNLVTFDLGTISGDGVMWCILPGMLKQQGESDYDEQVDSPRIQVLRQMEAADSSYTEDTVEQMTGRELGAALDAVNAATMQDAIVPSYDAANADDEHHIRYFTILYWWEDDGDYETVTHQKKLDIELRPIEGGTPVEDSDPRITEEKRTLKLTKPSLDLFAAKVKLFPKEENFYTMTRIEYNGGFNLSLKYKADGYHYIRIKMIEEWQNDQGAVSIGNLSNYVLHSNIYDNRREDGYLYLKTPVYSFDETNLPVITRVSASQPNRAVKVMITANIEVAQFNRAATLWGLGKLPWRNKLAWR